MIDTINLLLIKLSGIVFAADPNPAEVQVDTGASGLNFRIPTFSDLLTFAIRAFLTIAGLAALFYLLLGAFAWLTSGGDKGNVEKAQAKIQSAVVGVIMVVVALAIAWSIENIIFQGKICLGLTCPVKIPALLK